VAVVETGAAPTPKVELRLHRESRREGWQRRLPLLPALIYLIVVTQISFVVTLWYSFQNYFFDVLRSFGQAVDLLASGAVDPRPLLGEPLPLERWGEAVDRVRGGQGIKWHIRPS
jgi:ABC-type sugar transport system permease subunit